MNKNQPKLHITNGNCCGRCSRPRVPENSSRRKRLCTVFFHHILSVAGILRIPLSQPPKRQLPVTLDEILP